jgi:hypothetical protein
LQRLIQPGTKLVVVNFPHNPTGATLSAADWQAVIARCREVGAWLFSDEMYKFTGAAAPSGAWRLFCERHSCNTDESNAQTSLQIHEYIFTPLSKRRSCGVLAANALYDGLGLVLDQGPR